MRPRPAAGGPGPPARGSLRAPRPTPPRASFFDGLFGNNPTSSKPTPSTPVPPEPGMKLQPFPRDLTSAVRAARTAARAALQAGARFIEVEIPPSSVTAVAGDAEGANEMTYSAFLLRDFLREWDREAATTRVFFPDAAEARTVQRGRGMDPAAGSAGVRASFAPGSHKFVVDHLTTPTPFLDVGLDIAKRDVVARVQPTDTLLVAAYPSFNVNEFLALADLVSGAPDTPLICWNGELDRVRSSYYPPIFYPKVAAAGRRVLPLLETAYYVHNFKSSSAGGSLFRCYPGPWQVLDARGKVVAVSEAMPTLKTVALDILPAAAAAAAARRG